MLSKDLHKRIQRLDNNNREEIRRDTNISKKAMNNLAKEALENLELEGVVEEMKNFLEGQFDVRLENLLIAKDTIDERYYWIGKRKITSSQSMGKKMTEILEKNQNGDSQKTGLDAFI